MPKIIIDAGHTDHADPGAVANNTTEHTEVKAVALSVMDKVQTLHEFDAYEFYLVPTDKTLIQKIQYINSIAKDEDTIISIHLNSASPQATGTETYYLGGNDESKRRCGLIQQGVVSVMGLADRGVAADTTTRFGRLGIIRDTTGWAFLIELGFVTNVNDLTRIRTNGTDAVIEGLRQLMSLNSTAHLTPIRDIETQLDKIFADAVQLTTWERELVNRRKAWDLQLDKLRGLLLAQIDANKITLDANFVDFETNKMKTLALDNNTQISDFDMQIQKREKWDRDVASLRAMIKNYFQ